MASSAILIFVMVLASWHDIRALELSITPAHAHVQPGQRVKVMCQADVPLVGCQFKRVFSQTVYDLSQGAATPAAKDFAYYGTGLETGQCGINLTEYVREHTYDLIGCRARALNGAWQYAQMSLVINSNASYAMSITPSRPVALPGGNATILCQADQPISACLFKWNNQSWTSLNATTATPLYAYSGAGLERGQCGVTFLNATPALNGNVFCSAWTKARPKGYEAATVPLTVADAPNAPLLIVGNASLPASATLSASCVVRQARPAPRVTWLLAGDVVGVDTCADDATAAWRWPYEAVDCVATLALPVAWSDDGKELACRVEHEALAGGRVELKQAVQVMFLPRGPTSPLQLHGFRINGAAELTVHVWANPQPTFTWTFANESLAEGGALDGNRVQALRVTRDACGWQVKLVISSLAQSDLEHEVLLTANSALGSVDFQLHLDTAPAPPSEPEFAQCADRVKHLAAHVAKPALVADGNETRVDSLKHEVLIPAGGGCHTGLTVVILLLVLLVIGAATWYARSTHRLCFGRKQFARSSLADDCEDTDDADIHRMRL